MYFEMAKRNLKRHTLRSILALLGIIIGVMAISSLGILGGGLKQGISKNFEGVDNKLSDTTIYSDSIFSELSEVNKNDMIMIKVMVSQLTIIIFDKNPIISG
jgi:putative ABC transport system permease protein